MWWLIVIALLFLLLKHKKGIDWGYIKFHGISINPYEGKRILQKLAPYSNIIESVAKKFKIDPDMIRAIIWQESRGNPSVYRYEPHVKDTSYGLMQILSNTAKQVASAFGLPPITSVTMLYDPNLNILLGTAYFYQLLKRFNGNVYKAISAYNVGPNNKLLLKGYIPNPHYVRSVLSWYNSIKDYKYRMRR